MKTKKNIKNMVVGGVMLGVGSTVITGDSAIPKTYQGALGIASLALPVMGAKTVMDSTESLYPKSKKKNLYL